MHLGPPKFWAGYATDWQVKFSPVHVRLKMQRFFGGEHARSGRVIAGGTKPPTRFQPGGKYPIRLR